MTTTGRPPARILVLSGGLIHLVHQLAVLRVLPELQVSSGSAQTAPTGPPPLIAVLITGVLTRNPEALAALQQTIEPWFARLRQDPDSVLAGLQLVSSPVGLPAGPWDLVCLNNQWQRNQRDWLEQLDSPELLVCGDGLGLYYRCARELRAIVPSLLGLPIPEPGRQVRYVLSGRQPRWHRPPRPAQPAPQPQRQQLFEQLVECLRPQASQVVQQGLQAWPADRPLWLCSVPNLAHQFPQGRIAAAVLQQWRRHLQRRHGFRLERDRLLLIDHPKAPPQGSFGAVQEPWLAGPLRSALPLEVLIRLLQEARPGAAIHVCGMTSALYGVQQLTGSAVVWLPLAPLWQHNPGYRRHPLEFLHRSLRLARMALITGQSSPGIER